MADIVEILSWFINLVKEFFAKIGFDAKFLDDFTGKMQELL